MECYRLGCGNVSRWMNVPVDKTRMRLQRHSGLSCLETRSRNEEAINSTRNMVYSLKFLYFLLYQRQYFYLFLNWFSTQYPCGRRLYTCINTQKFKGLDSREIASLPCRDRKSDLHGTSFQSSPKIDRILITTLICIPWKFTTPDHGNFAN